MEVISFSTKTTSNQSVYSFTNEVSRTVVVVKVRVESKVDKGDVMMMEEVKKNTIWKDEVYKAKLN